MIMTPDAIPSRLTTFGAETTTIRREGGGSARSNIPLA